LYNENYDLDDMRDMLEDDDFFEDTYKDYISENEGKTNESKEECLKVLKEIVEEGREL
jgi:hypothetical protein